MNRIDRKRREFLKALSFAGLGAHLGLRQWDGRAYAQEAFSAYNGPFWIFLHAGGGWDVTSLCDPKGDGPERVNRYPVGDIRSVGNIRYAPLEGHDAFFSKYASRLLVINGIDTTTNGHDQGVRGTWSGKTGEGYPAIGAMIAGSFGAQAPMAFISAGGYSQTAGTTRAVRIGRDAGLLRRLAFPQRIQPESDDDSTYLGSAEAEDLLRQAAEARHARKMSHVFLPKGRRSRSQLYLAQAGKRELARVVEYLPQEMPRDNAQSRILVAYAAYRAGVSVSLSLGLGGFDTHGNHDENHPPRLAALLEAADFAMSEAERQGFADRVVLVMGSDFGRTPRYNGGAGKDHWPISSLMAMGPGISGNRVVGQTNEGHRPFKLDPVSLAPTGDDQDAPGIELTIEHVHRALRRFAGVDPALQGQFPLPVEDLNLFGQPLGA